MSGGRKVLVIIEATQEQHLALERAIITSEIKDPDSHVHLFISVSLFHEFDFPSLSSHPVCDTVR